MSARAGAEESPRLRLVTSDQDARAPRPPHPALDDSELLAALRSGDPAAATALHDRARPHVDRAIARLLGPGHPDREDLAQIALIEIVSSIDRFRGDCALDSWIGAVTAHVAYKHIRRKRIERRIFDREPPDENVLRTPARATPVVRDVLARVQRHLDAIDPAKAWTFVLHDVCGHDLREIAAITGVSVSSAQSRLVRGRRELHERIEADPELADALEELGGRP